MKYITKRPQPQALIAWTRTRSEDDEQATTWTYDDMPGGVRESIKRSLIAEQGGLCCYTGRRITLETSHIEHLKPQAACIGHEDTDYTNLLAAYPSSAPNTPGCPYGAHRKANWHEPELFVHPRRQDCEVRFRYRDTGKVVATRPDDAAVVTTIRQLGLDHPQLEQMRKAAIYAAIYDEELTKSQAQRLLAAMDQRDGQGQFHEFCFVLKQACEKYLKRFE
ncbi:MAG: retron system putative HNH endonuclease [Chloroflexales bacterium]